MMDFIKYKDFVDGVKKTVNEFIGKKYEDSSLDDMTSCILHYYNSLDSSNHHYRINIMSGAIIYDTTDSDVDGIDKYSTNTGCITMMSFKVIKNESNEITGINIKNHLSELNDWYLADVPQALDYMLARKGRKKAMAKIQKLQQKIDENMAQVKILEDIMQAEAWDKKMLYEDLKEYEDD